MYQLLYYFNLGKNMKIIICISCILLISLPGHSEKRFNWQDFSNFLAGIPVSKNSKYTTFIKSRYYKYHTRFINKFWHHLNIYTIKKAIEWNRKYMPDLQQDYTVFYPLSGADAVNMFLIYPSATNYLMIGQENSGIIKNFKLMSHRKARYGLASLRRIIASYGYSNYFTSKVLIKETRNYYLNGTLPPILIFMARLGFAIKKIQQVEVDRNGTLQIISPTNPMRYYNKTKGVKIFFTKLNSNKICTLTYLSMTLTNWTVNKRSATGKFLNTYPYFKTMLKSAIYLMHYRGCQGITRFVLRKSAMIVQDDSGVPYKMLRYGKWKITLFGRYVYIKVEGVRVNKDMTPKLWLLYNDYKKGSKPLPFKYGYGATVKGNGSNIQIAIKNKFLSQLKNK